uniref:Lipoxygenase domain-containing protein n=1 Tax=Populus davidiana TaxID=266767 RepID=A0A6M2EL62_9ROSI
MGFCPVSEMFHKVMERFCTQPKNKAKGNEVEGRRKIKGTVVLMKKNVLDFHDIKASFLDRVYELLGKGVSMQLVSAVHQDPDCLRGKLGKAASVEKWATTRTPLTAGETVFTITFEWDENMGLPGAIIIKNHHRSQLYLKTVALEDVPGHGRVLFICNSWVYPSHRYKYNRVFFSNKAYLPFQTPEPLRLYREEELLNLRGHGKGELKEWDRVYDYDYYNDLGNPDKGEEYARPILGGTEEYPYPRRGRTGRRKTKTDPHTEKRLPLLSLDIYVPRDERFGHLKFSDFLAYALKSLVQILAPEIKSLCDKTINEFDTFEDVLNLYEGGVKLPNKPTLHKIRDHIPWEMLRELVRNDGERLLKFPKPDVIKEDKSAWRTDEEFAREMLAGVNPVIISRLQEFPPASKLDPKAYGNQNSSIRKELIEENMNGLTVDQVLIMIHFFDVLICTMYSTLESRNTQGCLPEKWMFQFF